MLMIVDMDNDARPSRTRTRWTAIVAALVAGLCFGFLGGVHYESRAKFVVMKAAALTYDSGLEGLVFSDVAVSGNADASIKHRAALLLKEELLIRKAVVRDGAPSVQLFVDAFGKKVRLAVEINGVGFKLAASESDDKGDGMEAPISDIGLSLAKQWRSR